MSFLNFLSQKHTLVIFQDQRLFETEVIKEKIVPKSQPRHSNSAFLKNTINSEMLGVRD